MRSNETQETWREKSGTLALSQASRLLTLTFGSFRYMQRQGRADGETMRATTSVLPGGSNKK